MFWGSKVITKNCLCVCLEGPSGNHETVIGYDHQNAPLNDSELQACTMVSCGKCIYTKYTVSLFTEFFNQKKTNQSKMVLVIFGQLVSGNSCKKGRVQNSIATVYLTFLGRIWYYYLNISIEMSLWITGWYGESCHQVCRCENDAECNHINGSCACTAGWMGVWCQTPCQGNFYIPEPPENQETEYFQMQALGFRIPPHTPSKVLALWSSSKGR